VQCQGSHHDASCGCRHYDDDDDDDDDDDYDYPTPSTLRDEEWDERQIYDLVRLILRLWYDPNDFRVPDPYEIYRPNHHWDNDCTRHNRKNRLL
jgi:hypothetical protein